MTSPHELLELHSEFHGTHECFERESDDCIALSIVPTHVSTALMSTTAGLHVPSRVVLPETTDSGATAMPLLNPLPLGNSKGDSQALEGPEKEKHHTSSTQDTHAEGGSAKSARSIGRREKRKHDSE